jgi:hypothetical protein
MKVKLFTLILVLTLALVGLIPINAQAQAFSTSFTTSITYQNVGSAATTSLQVNFYPSATSTTPVTISRPNLDAGASSSVFIGNLSEVTAGFQGSAVMVSDQPLLATLVQIPQDSTTVFVRPLSNGFAQGDATALIATVLKNTFGAHTVFSIQNTDSEANDVNIKFYNTSATMVHEMDQTIQSGASYYVDTSTITELGTSFNGSAVITAERTDNSDGSIVGSAMELDITGTGAKAFESVAAGARTIYMPSALCDVYGGQRTAYAVQNTNLSDDTDVTVTYSNGLFETQNIGAGSKKSFSACNVVSAGFVGSAKITSTDTDVVAVGKAFGAGLSTAFIGSDSGSAKLALPYVRYAPDSYYLNGSRQRTSIAIQNVGAAEIPAGSITLTYTDAFGHSGTHVYNDPLDVGEKFNSKATSAGLDWFGMAEPPASGYGGGVSITCTATNCELIAVARVTTYVPGATPAEDYTAAEDYNAMPAP